MASSNNGKNKFIHNLEYIYVKELCRILDRDNKWEELGGAHMQFDMTTIDELRRCERRGDSPTERLLSLWGHQNHTVTLLFVLLSKMHHYQAMLVLKPLVDSRFHQLIFEGENIQIRKESNDGTEAGLDQNGASHTEASTSNVNLLDKNMNVGSINLNVSTAERGTPRDKVLFPIESTGDRKIVNVPENGVSNDCITAVTSNPGAAAATPLPPLPNVTPTGNDAVAGQTESKEDNCSASDPQEKMSNASDASSMAELCLTIPQIAYSELMIATNNWSKDNVLGKGGFGTVFKGNWKNTFVAIKRIEQRGAESAESYQIQMEQSLRELNILNACRHDNILPVYGFSVGGAEPCLVYQFMPNGSLEDRLRCKRSTIPLTWSQRHNIAVGTARGLQFLHSHEKQFIHGDIKSANILLNSNFEPRIGDFGLAREGPQSQYTHMQVSRVHGTLPYLPDEFLRCRQMSTKVDTFSFGIVLFELGTGLRAYDEARTKKFLKDHVGCQEDHLDTLRDARAGLCELDIFMHLMTLGKLCVSYRPRDRPEMKEVLKKLEIPSSVRRSPQYPVQISNENAHNGYPARSPVPFRAPTVSPDPTSHMNRIPLGLNIGYGTPFYKLHQHGHVSPTLLPASQHNNPFLEINYGQGANIPLEGMGIPSVDNQKHENQVVEGNRQVAMHEYPSPQLVPTTGEKAPLNQNGALQCDYPGTPSNNNNKREYPQPAIAWELKSWNISHPSSMNCKKSGEMVEGRSAREGQEESAKATLHSSSDVSGLPLLSVLGVKNPVSVESDHKITAQGKPVCI